MAKVVGSNLVVFDAEGQGEGYAAWLDTQRSVYESEEATPAMGSETVVFTVPLYIRQFKVVTGAGGDVQLYTRKVAGDADPTEENKPQEHQRKEILFLDETPASDTLWVPMNGRFDGVYVNDLPTNGKIYMYLGEE